jgi:hypothetical protein
MTRLWVVAAFLKGLVPLMLLATVVQAVEVDGLYQAAVQVSDRSANERKRAIQDGFKDILVRVSGSSLIANQDQVVEAQADADRFVVQYGYQTRELPALDRDKPIKATFLSVKYDAAAINQFLRRGGNPIWSSNRPKIVLWGAFSGTNGRQLLGGNELADLQAAVQSQADRRGLPVQLPLYDNEDLSLVRAGDIWGMFIDPVIMASQRYQGDVVALAKIAQRGGTVQIKAAVSIEGRQQWWDVSASTVDDAIALYMDQLADRVGETYAVLVSQDIGEQVILDIKGVDRLQDFARLDEYLQDLIAIRLLHLNQLQGNRLQYRVTLESNLDALQQSIRLDKKLIVDEPEMLQPVEPEAEPALPQPASLPTVYYRWNR